MKPFHFTLFGRKHASLYPSEVGGEALPKELKHELIVKLIAQMEINL
jgi:hypothetical protein